MSNKFYGEGNLGANPDLKIIDQNDPDRMVSNLRVYFDNSIPKDDGGFEDKDGFWMNVEIWGKRAQACHDLFKKGDRVSVAGKVVSQTWEEDKDGVIIERQRFQIKANRVNADLLSQARNKTDEAS